MLLGGDHHQGAAVELVGGLRAIDERPQPLECGIGVAVVAVAASTCWPPSRPVPPARHFLALKRARSGRHAVVRGRHRGSTCFSWDARASRGHSIPSRATATRQPWPPRKKRGARERRRFATWSLSDRPRRPRHPRGRGNFRRAQPGLGHTNCAVGGAWGGAEPRRLITTMRLPSLRACTIVW